MTAALVSLVGPPGSGKTTIAHWLAPALNADLLLEDYAGNPFLAESYTGTIELRLAGQIWFLLSRVNQLARVHWPAGRRVVTDYAYLQDRVYAEMWLAGRQLDAYDRIALDVAALVQEPTVLIHLDGPLDLLGERIAGRGRGYESTFTPEFLQRLSSGYRDVLVNVATPVIEVDIAQRDLAEAGQQAWLVDALREIL